MHVNTEMQNCKFMNLLTKQNIKLEYIVLCGLDSKRVVGNNVKSVLASSDHYTNYEIAVLALSTCC